MSYQSDVDITVMMCDERRIWVTYCCTEATVPCFSQVVNAVSGV